MRWLGDAEFARTPGLRLLTARRLPRSLRGLLAHLDPGQIGGLMVSRVTREAAFMDPGTATAWRLIRSGPLPLAIREHLDAEGNRALGKLVLDGWLTIEGPGGAVTGAAAASVILGSVKAPRPAGALGRLSSQALAVAAALPPMSSSDRAARLYRYNTCPASVARRARYPTDGDVERRVRDAGFPARGWVRTGGVRTGWLQWTHGEGAGAAFKLYLSPQPDGLADALGVVMREAEHLPITAFKAGCTRAGMLRPDRLVVYLARRRHVVPTGQALVRALAGMEAAGVPFTAAIDREGLVSWGADVRRPFARPDHESGDSWRSWVTQLLARAIGTALRASPPAVAPVDFALLRLTLEGVDPARFAPRPAFLREWSPAR